MGYRQRGIHLPVAGVASKHGGWDTDTAVECIYILTVYCGQDYHTIATDLRVTAVNSMRAAKYIFYLCISSIIAIYLLLKWARGHAGLYFLFFGNK